MHAVSPSSHMQAYEGLLDFTVLKIQVTCIQQKCSHY